MGRPRPTTEGTADHSSTKRKLPKTDSKSFIVGADKNQQPAHALRKDQEETEATSLAPFFSLAARRKQLIASDSQSKKRKLLTVTDSKSSVLGVDKKQQPASATRQDQDRNEATLKASFFSLTCKQHCCPAIPSSDESLAAHGEKPTSPVQLVKQTEASRSMAEEAIDHSPNKCKLPEVMAPRSKQDHKKPKLYKKDAPSKDNNKRTKLEQPKEATIPGDDVLAHLIAGFLARQFSSADQDTMDIHKAFKYRLSLLSHSRLEEVKAIWRTLEEQIMQFLIDYQMQLKQQ